MPDLVSEDTSFSCPFCTSQLKLKVASSSAKSDSKNLANLDNSFFPPPGGQCTVCPSAPIPCVPSVNVLDPGQGKVQINEKIALGAGCKFMCAKGGLLTVSSPGQTKSKHDEASGASTKWDKVKDFYNQHQTVIDGLIDVATLIPAGRGAKAGFQLLRSGGKILGAIKMADKKAVKNYWVYQSKNASGKVQYVGITNNLPRRAAQHLEKKGIQIDKIPGLGPLTKQEARGVEQSLIELHGLEKNGGNLINKINSISPNNPIYKESLKTGQDILKDIGYPGLKK